MPKSSRLDMTRHCGQIEAAAMRLFQIHGVENVSVATVMKQVGLTHGGFYNHFASKEDLAARTCGRAFEETAKLRSGWTDPDAGGKRSLRSFVTRYLQPTHRDRPAEGCPTVAYAADVARAPEGSPLREEYVRGMEEVTAELEGLLGQAVPGRRGVALTLYATLVGALTLSRAAKGAQRDALSDAVLEEIRSVLLAQIAELEADEARPAGSDAGTDAGPVKTLEAGGAYVVVEG